MFYDLCYGFLIQILLHWSVFVAGWVELNGAITTRLLFRCKTVISFLNIFIRFDICSNWFVIKKISFLRVREFSKYRSLVLMFKSNSFFVSYLWKSDVINTFFLLIFCLVRMVFLVRWRWWSNRFWQVNGLMLWALSIIIIIMILLVTTLTLFNGCNICLNTNNIKLIN